MVNALLGLNILLITYYQLLNSIVKENAMYIQKRIKVLAAINGKGTNLRRFWIGSAKQVCGKTKSCKRR